MVSEIQTVEFEIQKIYKGINSSTKRIILNTDFNPATCGNDEDEAAKKGQEWIVFVYRDEKDNSLHYGGMCDPSSQLEKASDLSEYENKIFSVKDKQAIIGTVVDDMKIKGIKNIEVVLEGEGQNLTTRTDEKGFYYFPVISKGNYKIIINIPFPAFISGGSFIVKENPIKENANEDAKILKNILNYEIQLKDGEFNYNEIDLFVL